MFVRLPLISGGAVIAIEDATVTVMVADLDRSQAFYEGVLGFELLYRAAPHFCMLERADGAMLRASFRDPDGTALYLLQMQRGM